jgi:hypothetical protein
MNEWAKAVVHPLGLAGFALFLVFLFQSRNKRSGSSIRLVFIAMSVVCLVGGLALAHQELETKQNPAPAATPSGVVQQITKGRNSPAVANVGGDVTIQSGTDNIQQKAGTSKESGDSKK